LNEIFKKKINCLVSDETMRKFLIYLAFGAFYMAKKPLLSKRHKDRRVRIREKWLFKPDSFWNDVIFSDECKFNLSNSDGCVKVWREPGRRLDSKYINSTIKHECRKVMVWGCFSSREVKKLFFYRWNNG
jgi:hypothetical protein